VTEALAKWMRHKRRAEQPLHKVLSVEERRSLQLLRREAALLGSKLSSGGKGGLSPSLVLGVLRRDKYTCKVCGELGSEDNGGVGLHHKGGVVESKWLSKKGHENTPNNLVTICTRCHDRVHNKAREEGTDSSQVQPEGDKERSDSSHSG